VNISSISNDLGFWLLLVEVYSGSGLFGWFASDSSPTKFRKKQRLKLLKDVKRSW